MKKCENCGELLSEEDGTATLCADCLRKQNRKELTKKVLKVGVPLAVAAGTIVTYVALKGKGAITSLPKVPIKSIVEAGAEAAAEIVPDTTPVFLGLTQSKLDELVKSTGRGVKALVEGDTLRFVYKSASGKMTNSAILEPGPLGEYVMRLGNGPYAQANAPRFFFKKIYDATH